MAGPTLVRSGTTLAAGPAETGAMCAFDYGRREQVSAAQLEQSRRLHEKCLREISTALTAFLGTAVTLRLGRVVQTGRSEFLKAASSPTCMLSLSLRPFRGTALLEISPSLLYPALEIILGGGTGSGADQRAHLTEIEQSVLDLLFDAILRCLREVWRSAAEVDFRAQRLWTDPVAAAACESQEQLVLFEGEMSIAQAAGQINFGIPAAIIEVWNGSGEDRLIQSHGSDDEQRLSLLRLLGPMRMHIEARLQGATVLVRHLCALKVGDVLTVFHPIDGAVDGLVNGKTKFRGHLVSNGPNVKFQIGECVHSPLPARERES